MDGVLDLHNEVNILSTTVKDKQQFLKIFIYLAALALSCGAQDLLVTACGIQFPDKGSNPGPRH